jgi:hypothetical protein
LCSFSLITIYARSKSKLSINQETIFLLVVFVELIWRDPPQEVEELDKGSRMFLPKFGAIINITDAYAE